MDSVIKINNLTKEIKGTKILDNISIEITKGKIFGFIGHNGSGKSMLFKAICGFINPTSGEIYVRGKKIGSEVDFPDSVGALIEHPGFLPDLTGMQNLRYLAQIQNKIKDDEIREAMRIVGLNPDEKKKVRAYSLGMKQRLGIAQVIMENPEILILDEPFNGLDKNGVESIRNLLTTLKTKDKTILLCSHNSEDISILCDHVWELEYGTINKLR